MSEAKETTDRPNCELWAGPRAVLVPLRFDPTTPGLATRHDKVTDQGFDGVEWDLRVGTESAAVTLNVLANSISSRPPRPCAVACRCDTTNAGDAIHALNAVIDTCDPLDAVCLNVTLPPIVGVCCDHNGADAQAGFRSYQEHLNFTFTLLHEVRFTAEQHGVVVAVEAASGGGLLSPVELRELLDKANSGSVGACLDVARLSQIGSPADWMETLRHRVGTVRMPDQATCPSKVDAMFTSMERGHYDRTIICPSTTLIARCRESMRCYRNV